MPAKSVNVPFVNARAMVAQAMEQGYAVPAMNTNGGTYDIARAALEAAQELHSPLILQAYQPNLEYRGPEYFVALAGLLCRQLDVTVPVALHLDHGESLEYVAGAIRAGFTSVMIDASHEPLEANVRKTRQAIELARAHGVSVEAEIGYVAGNEPAPPGQAGLSAVPLQPAGPLAKTDVDEAMDFAGRTGVDMLAVAIGTAHGVYQRQTAMDFDLLAAMRKALPVPLVQHGTCGISPEDLGRLAKGGMAKINFGEPFRYNYIRYFDELSREMEHRWHPWRIMREVKERLKGDMKGLIIAVGAAGKAP